MQRGKMGVVAIDDENYRRHRVPTMNSVCRQVICKLIFKIYKISLRQKGFVVGDELHSSPTPNLTFHVQFLGVASVPTRRGDTRITQERVKFGISKNDPFLYNSGIESVRRYKLDIRIAQKRVKFEDVKNFLFTKNFSHIPKMIISCTILMSILCVRRRSTSKNCTGKGHFWESKNRIAIFRPQI